MQLVIEGVRTLDALALSVAMGVYTCVLLVVGTRPTRRWQTVLEYANGLGCGVLAVWLALTSQHGGPVALLVAVIVILSWVGMVWLAARRSRSERLQEVVVLFNRDHQSFMTYWGVPWEPMCQEISAANQAIQAAGTAQGLRLDGPAELEKPLTGPHALLRFRRGQPGAVEVFSSEPLTEREQTIITAAIAAVPGWSIVRMPPWLERREREARSGATDAAASGLSAEGETV